MLRLCMTTAFWFLISLSRNDHAVQAWHCARPSAPLFRSLREPVRTRLQAGQSESNDSALSSTSTKNKKVPRWRGFPPRITGESTPYQFPVRPIEMTRTLLPQNPFKSVDFSRLDSSNDGIFYTIPRLVYHIDEPAVASLTQYYKTAIPVGSDVLDICSSWVSHYHVDFPETMSSIRAIGMNGIELFFNDQLTDGYIVLDLNLKDPKLPFDDETFDVITCALSIDYLIHPIQVLQECHRVLRPNGKVIVSFSNRCFALKATSLWMKTSDQVHVELINAFFHYAGGFAPRQAFEITAQLPGTSKYQDPMFVVEATKSVDAPA